MSGRGKDVHLVILIHGLWGSPAHLAVAKEELEAAYRDAQSGPSPSAALSASAGQTKVSGPADDPVVQSTVKGEKEELVVVIAGGMTSQLTYDGVDVCASRVAFEVDEQVTELERQGKRITKFSITGYSLGGLVARYLVGLLHSRSPSFFDQYPPASFSTIATPHLGIPRYNTFLSTSLCWLGSRLLSRSGEQLYVTDQYSDHVSRPLLEIMADPNQVFAQGLDQFRRLRIYSNAIKDDTVPYPSSGIDTVDHFAEWAERGVEVEADDDGIMINWTKGTEGQRVDGGKRGWSKSLGTLPPVLRYRYPYNYIILLFLPIMLPLIMLLIISRSLLDTRRSQRRLQKLAQTSVPSPDTHSGQSTPSTPIPSPLGLSVTSLRQAIRRVERSIESDLIDSADSNQAPIQKDRSVYPRDTKEHPTTPLSSGSADHEDGGLRVHLKDSQLRMAVWLNSLPWKKTLTWYPEIANSHAVIIVRDPALFPVHNRGRGLLRRWARGVLDLEAK